MTKAQIRSFRDLDVYQNAYKCMLTTIHDVLNQLPDRERYDLRDQLLRSSKAIPRLIAEGYAKRHQKAGFQKYLDDALAESNETIVSLEQCRDIYHINAAQIEQLVDQYDKISRQLYKLSVIWTSFTKAKAAVDLPNRMT